jgi:hypothetical protein
MHKRDTNYPDHLDITFVMNFDTHSSLFRLFRSTEHHGRVVNTPASYSGGSGFKSRPEAGYPDCDFCGCPQSLQANARIVP